MVTTSSSSAERQRAFYDSAVAEFGDALSRLMRSYERDTDKRADLRQEIHFALWKSFGRFDERCSMRTWTYRVARDGGSDDDGGDSNAGQGSDQQGREE